MTTMHNAQDLRVTRSKVKLETLLTKGTVIAHKPGVTFYEHPVYGDEAGLLMVMNDEVFQTDEYDAPDFDIAGVIIAKD